MKNFHSNIKLNPKLAIRKVDNVYLIITLDNRLHKIETDSGVFILDLLMKGPTTLDKILDRIMEVFDISDNLDSVRQSIEDFLNSLLQKGIIILQGDEEDLT